MGGGAPVGNDFGRPLASLRMGNILKRGGNLYNVHDGVTLPTKNDLCPGSFYQCESVSGMPGYAGSGSTLGSSAPLEFR